MAKTTFTNTKYPNLQIAGTTKPDGKPDKPGAGFVDGELVTEDAAVVARVKEAMKHDASLGIVEGSFSENVSAPELTSIEDLGQKELAAMALGMGLDDSGSQGDLVERITAAQLKAGRHQSVSPTIRETTADPGFVTAPPDGSNAGNASRGDPDADPILDGTVGSFPVAHPDRPVDGDGNPIAVGDTAGGAGGVADPAASRG